MVTFIIYLFFLYFNLIRGQFPRLCTNKHSLQSRECCPLAQDGSKCGAYSMKGFCGNLSSEQALSPVNEVRAKTIMKMSQ